MLEDQKVSVQTLLTEECDGFSKNIGNIESLKLKLDVTDPLPICKLYHKIHTQIYSEVKVYFEDLSTNE